MKGEAAKWSWETPGKPTTPTPEGSNIALMNVKSDMKPFVISPEGCTLGAYGGSHDGSRFRWRDHWPTTMEPVVGRDASGTQAAHGSFFHIMRIPIYEEGEEWVSKVLVHGMTDSPVGELAPTARSWLYPPELRIAEGAVTSGGYNRAEKAYVLNCKERGNPSRVQLALAASEESPVINPAFVINGWGPAGASMSINGKAVRKARISASDTGERLRVPTWSYGSGQNRRMR
jgi:hypothetical protein